MTEEQLKAIWQSENEEKETINFHALSIKDMNQQIKAFEKKIEKRNNREVFVAILGIIFLGYNLFTVSDKLELLGGMCGISYCLWVIYKLKKVQAKQPRFDMESSIRQQLLDYRAYIKKEQQLLKTIFYWYMLPAFPAMVFFSFGGGREWSLIREQWPHLFLPFGFLLFMSITIYLLNQEAADREFTPLLRDIENTLQNLE